MVQPQLSVSELKTTSITPSHKTASAVHFLQSLIGIYFWLQVALFFMSL